MVDWQFPTDREMHLAAMDAALFGRSTFRMNQAACRVEYVPFREALAAEWGVPVEQVGGCLWGGCGVGKRTRRHLPKIARGTFRKRPPVFSRPRRWWEVAADEI